MHHPFSGIIIRYLPPSKSVCQFVHCAAPVVGSLAPDSAGTEVEPPPLGAPESSTPAGAPVAAEAPEDASDGADPASADDAAAQHDEQEGQPTEPLGLPPHVTDALAVVAETARTAQIAAESMREAAERIIQREDQNKAVKIQQSEKQVPDSEVGRKLYNWPLKDELHINLWEISKKNAKPFIDIGVMLGRRDDVGALVVDLPWKVELKDVSDLGARLNGEKSVAAIFNEVVHYDGFAEGNFANISFRRDNDDVKPFSLLRLNSQLFEISEIYVDDGVLASRLTIRIPEILSSVPEENRRVSAYVRFRIRNIPSEVYENIFTQKDRTLISSNTVARIIDFRINVRRGVPEELLSGNEKLAFPNFSKIHCFLTTERDEECISQSKNYVGYRSLMDEEIWNEYIRLDSTRAISAESSVRNYLGYQWTASSEDNSFVKDLIVLGRFAKRKSSIFLITRFLLLGVLFGGAGNGVWEITKNCGIYIWKENCPIDTIPLFWFVGISVALIMIEPIYEKVKKFVARVIAAR
ncbi:hypothetical protein ACSEQ0_26185 [Pseudomonas aeruginosa]